MKLTKLSAAWLPGWTCGFMPAPARMDAGTASQHIPGVMRTLMHGACSGRPPGSLVQGPMAEATVHGE
jgi:hypothetical protein